MKAYVWFALSFFVLSCGPKSPVSHVKNELSGSSFYYYDQQDRVDVLESFKRATKMDYALIDIKKQRMGIDTDEIFAAAIDLEKSTADVEGEFEQADANLRFIDRVSLLVAKYQDTHFGIKAITTKPTILNGLTLREVSGEVYIVGYTPLIMEKNFADLGDENYHNIGIGDKVLEIDGRKPSDLADELVPYENGSTPAYSRSQAVASIPNRDYNYPRKNYSDWKIESKAAGRAIEVRLPWYYDFNAQRLDALTYLKQLRFRTFSELKLQFDETTKKWNLDRKIETKGLQKFETPKDALGLKTWYSTLEMSGGYFKTIPCLNTGYIVKNGKAYPFIQLFHYIMQDVTDKNGTTLPWEKVVQNFVKEINDKGSDSLIVDLRDNMGGITSNPTKLLAAIAKPGEKYPAFHRALRITRHIRQDSETSTPTDNILTQDNDEFDYRTNELITDAIAQGRRYTIAAPAEKDVAAPEGHPGFSGKVVAMISPACISSCDITAILFQASKRVTLIGSHSNGTGAGQSSTDTLNSTFRDPYQLVTTTMLPNMLFGYPTTSLSDPNDANGYYQLNSENVPVRAEERFQYTSTLEDYTAQSQGWYNRAIAAFAE